MRISVPLSCMGNTEVTRIETGELQWTIKCIHKGLQMYSRLNAKWQPITSNSLLAHICILLEVFFTTSKREIVM